MPTLSRQNIYERDGGQCQYTGKKLNSNECNLDHVIPRSKGGSNTWENLVLCDPAVNSKKGNRFNHEVGLKLSKIPKAPRAAFRCQHSLIKLNTIRGVTLSLNKRSLN